MGHKFAYFEMFWIPLHISMAVSFLVINITITQNWIMVAMWGVNFALCIGEVFWIFPKCFNELTPPESERKGTSLIKSI